MTTAKPLLIPPHQHSVDSQATDSPTSPVRTPRNSCLPCLPHDKDAFLNKSPSQSFLNGSFPSHLSKPSFQSAHPSFGPERSFSNQSLENLPRESFSTNAPDRSEPHVSMPDLQSFSQKPLKNLASGSAGELIDSNNRVKGKWKPSAFDFTKLRGFRTSRDDEISAPPAPPSGAGSPREPGGDPDEFLEGVPGSKSKKEDPPARVVYINNPVRTNEKYEMSGNQVRTSKYTLLTFLPRNLFEQFHRFAYIYFLLIVILNQIPALAVFGRTASLFPLVFVLVLTAIKDGYEDWGRHRSDKVENNRTSLVLQDGHYRPKRWRRIQVGEMVKVHANEAVPCDMVLLGSSDASGVAYVETLNLDGESNLKSRYARQETSDKHPELGPITGAIICELPNRNIYEFTAYMDLNGVRVAIGVNNIVLRGCEVKNTAWVVGVVVYAGKETKAMLNSSGAQSKRSRLEQYMNRETGWLVVFLIAICFAGGLGMGLWVQEHLSMLPIIQYYKLTGDYMFSGAAGEGIIGFLSFIIIFQIMIPISLYISMEVVRLGQSYFMIRDMEMYHPDSNTRFQCRALNINEDLGQIKYLFSDKTGTLTENKMEFHTASIDGIDYSDASSDMPTIKAEISIGPEDTILDEGLFQQSILMVFALIM